MLKIRRTSCERATTLVSLQLDDELTLFEEVELRDHLARCSACRAYEREAAGFTSLVRESSLEPFDLPIPMPRRHRLVLGPLQAGVAAAVIGVIGLGALLGVARNDGGFPTSFGSSTSLHVASSTRPAYLDSASYELRLIRQMSKTHAGGGIAVPL
jgi:anti-sigma factor RsiW